MGATSYLTPVQLSTLLACSGWTPLPWSPALDWSIRDPLESSDPQYQSMVDGGLLVVEAGETRVNGFLDPALAVVSQPDVQVSMAVPAAPPLFLCRGADLVISCFEFVDGAIALSYPVLEDEILPLVGEILGTEDPGVGALGFRARLAPFDMEIAMLAGARAGISVSDLVDALREQRWQAGPATVTAALDRLETQHLIARSGDRARVTPELAPLFGPGLRYGLAIRRVERFDEHEDIGVVHVYRNVDRLLGCRPVPTGDDQLSLDCWETSPSELAGLIAVMTMTEAGLAALEHAQSASA